MTSLSVNVNKLATLRNSRGRNLPDVTALSRKILDFGAHGITVHPRPDGRHIRIADVLSIRKLLDEWNLSAGLRRVEFNIEGFPSDEFLRLIADVKPDQVTLVPDPPEALTSDAGWELAGCETVLSGVIRSLRGSGVRVSVFVDPHRFNEREEQALARLQPDRIELYTERFCDAYLTPQRRSVTAEYRRTAEAAHALGIGLNAGHDLNQENLGYLIEQIPWIEEVSIGHALICEALEQGLAATVGIYLRILEQANASHSHAARP